MPIRLTFDFYGDTQLDRTLADLEENVEDARPVWDAIADSLVRAERRQFATEGGYASGGWAPLSPNYAAWKARHYPGKKILHREGDLEGSLTRRPLGIEVIEPSFAVLGSDVEHGKYHQGGLGRNPQRRPVELPASLRREWAKKIQRFVMTGNP